MKKKIFIIPILFLCLFINMSGVKAAETSCTWELPYSGIINNGGSYSIYTGDPAQTVSSFTVEFSSRNVSKKMKANGWNFVGWHGANKKFSDSDLSKKIMKSGECPEYLKLVIKSNDNVAKSSSSDLLSDKINLYSSWASGSNNVYKADYDLTKISWTDFEIRDKITVYLPLKIQNSAVQSKPIKKFQEKALKIWKDNINNEKQFETNTCGDSEDQYFNKDNYSDVSNFEQYAMGAYQSTQKSAHDATISESCWNHRQSSLNKRKAARLYFESLSLDFKGYSDTTSLLELQNYAYLPIEGSEATKQAVEEEKNKLEETVKSNKLQEDLQINSCLALCQTSATTNATAISECQKGTTYKNCYKALKKCKDENNLDLKKDKINTDVNTCMKDEMGEDAFESLQSKYTTLITNLDTYSLKKAKVPSLNVKYSKGYKVKCEDISFLHNIWVAIEIIAPILVIAFGSLDLAKSVIAGDDKKIKDARNKVIKRLAAAILLILSFAIVSVLVNLTNNDDVKDTSLIKCIVDGE